MKKVLSWPVYYQLSEIYTAPLNVIWFVFGAAMSFQQYHMFNLINILLCLVDVFLFDLAVNIADNYYDYLHGKDRHFLTDINPIGRLKLPLTDVRNLVWISYFISAIPGIILVYRTGWPVLIMGVVGYFIGIFYTAGPKPLNATPICELVVSFFISYFIMLVSIYVTIYGTYPLTWNLALTTLIRCLPLTLIFYALQLANNTCDLREDLNNGRHTLASYTGKKYALKIIKTLIIAGLLFPIIVVLFGLAKWPLIFSCFLLPILWPKLKQFFEHPDKQTTYLQMIKYLSIFFITYIAIYTVLVLV